MYNGRDGMRRHDGQKALIKPTFHAYFTALALALIGCQDPSRTEPPEIALRLPAVDSEASLQETRDRVKRTVRDTEVAATLLDALANARDALREGDRPASRGHVYEFVRRLEGLVASDDISRKLGDELLLYAGDCLSTIGFDALCATTPGSNPPAFLYSSRIVCVARLPANPADPDTPLPLDSVEHCNPVAESLQTELFNKALTACLADSYGCVPVPGRCATVCQKDAEPGFTVPRVNFTPDSVNCDDEPVKKHSCYATGFHYCSCSCSPVEDT